MDELKKLWEPAAQGKITHWNQVNPAWPNEPVKLFGAGSDSGTFDYFTEAIVGKSKASRGDFTASEDDNVLVQGVAGDVNAIGYFGYAYYAENQNKLKALPIVEKEGKPAVSPSEQTVLNGTLPAAVAPDLHLRECQVAGQAGSEEVRRLLHEPGRQAGQGSEVRAAARRGLQDRAWSTSPSGKKGTVFGGKNEVGITIDELLKREAKL